MNHQDYARVLPHLTLVEWHRGEIIHESCAVQRYAYFPVDSLASIVLLLEDGHSCEIAVVGNDGLLGLSIFTQTESMPSYSTVQVAGSVYRLKAAVLRELVHDSEHFRSLLLRYTQVLFTQIGQSATCNRYHTIHQQLARWLLIAIDHLPDNHLELTQEQIAHSLGVRREGVTEAAGRLQKAKLIEYRRGHIHVLDRPGLEHECCECYRTVKRETERLLPE
ncbi:Crp/Fnr family transcriptional regulator [Wenzhouxiangella sediminis]|jgi:CRP-like cAMP-binding protein|uniref:Crp/Fnr family transcriptional regulator n=1 Tax=Wenzhouxiangella sediminis TaxID=1792836 RepID=A0A3E1KAV0_9GAMM|nr:Crp/Fnr family transcriptional regulator [Wenzhouxiangella sediminis]MEE4303020.1 Crp/Fnr family transcriptional regulator [Wenzhouxiangella sp.]RFF31588.1 Crp/Fnr family transcriptional regulator [Wenzhouxiangella sediminis]